MIRIYEDADVSKEVIVDTNQDRTPVYYCPFCNSEDPLELMDPDFMDDELQYKCKCTNCGASGYVTELLEYGNETGTCPDCGEDYSIQITDIDLEDTWDGINATIGCDNCGYEEDINPDIKYLNSKISLSDSKSSDTVDDYKVYDYSYNNSDINKLYNLFIKSMKPGSHSEDNIGNSTISVFNKNLPPYDKSTHNVEHIEFMVSLIPGIPYKFSQEYKIPTEFDVKVTDHCVVKFGSGVPVASGLNYVSKGTPDKVFPTLYPGYKKDEIYILSKKILEYFAKNAKIFAKE